MLCMDVFTKQQRSLNMSKIKSTHTVPELAVRKVLTELGFRYRLHGRNFPGKPDVVIRKTKTTIFINGCFWHQHPDCKRATIPKSNLDYWLPKLKKNTEKQNEAINGLKEAGWHVIIIWECETKNRKELIKKIQKNFSYE